MKKTTRILAAVMSVALIGAVPISSVYVVAEDVSITDKNQNNTYYIFYKDIDTIIKTSMSINLNKFKKLWKLKII